MGKQNWKPGNMLNPVPAVMVSVTDKAGNNNIITVAWAGTVLDISCDQYCIRLFFFDIKK